MSYEPTQKSIRCLNDVYLYSLKSGAPEVQQPSEATAGFIAEPADNQYAQ